MNLDNFFILTLILCLSSSLAHAQSIVWDDEVQEAKPVYERLPEELRAKPLTYGGLQYQASSVFETRYDDNILARSSKSSDYIVAIKPKILLSKDYSAHQFKAGASANIERFASRSAENKEDLSLFAKALLFANHKWEFPLFAGFNKKARQRNRPQALSSHKPLDINRFRASAGATRRFNRLSLGALGEYVRVDNENGRQINSGAAAIYDDDDRDIYRAKLKARYDISQGSPGEGGAPSHILFADFIAGRHEYDRLSYVNGRYSGTSGDRNEFAVLAGIESDYKGLLFAKLGAGYTRQEFDDQTLEDVETIDMLARIAYNFTPKLTLRLDASRELDQDSGFTQGITETGYILGADYELLHNLYMRGELGYSDFEFEGVNREDEEISAGLGLTYYHSPRLESHLGLQWQDRSSSAINSDFDRLVLLLSLTGKL
jgi:hypothetical protein